MNNDKVLTIAVCAYNMEQYLSNCLDSFVVSNLDKIEVLVLNDGSKDKTGEIAESYVEKYPDSFVHVNKENGGWGSNLNVAVKMARGKYFREVDADDWLDKNVLKEVVNDLMEKDVDMYVNNHIYWSSETDYRVNCPDWNKYSDSKHKMEEVDKFYMPIWDAAFRTSLIQEHYIDLPRKTLYTDNLFVQQAIPYMNTVYFNSKTLYNYRVGRDGQSVDVNSLYNHYKDLLLVWEQSVNSYLSLSEEYRRNKHSIAKLDYTYRIFMDYLIKMYDRDKNSIRDAMIQMDENLKKVDFLYKEEGKAKRIGLLRATGYRTANVVNKIIK